MNRVKHVGSTSSQRAPLTRISRPLNREGTQVIQQPAQERDMPRGGRRPPRLLQNPRLVVGLYVLGDRHGVPKPPISRVACGVSETQVDKRPGEGATAQHVPVRSQQTLAYLTDKDARTTSDVRQCDLALRRLGLSLGPSRKKGRDGPVRDQPSPPAAPGVRLRPQRLRQALNAFEGSRSGRQGNNWVNEECHAHPPI